MSENITIFNDDGKELSVSKDSYVRLKCRDLREFGYSSLTQDEVREELDALLRGEESQSIIGRFIQSDIENPV